MKILSNFESNSNKMIKKFFKCICIFVFLIILWSCQQDNKNNHIKIATLKGPSSMGMIKMIDSLNLSKNSNIEVKIYSEPLQIRKLMLENEIDCAILPTTMGAILYNKGIQYKIAAIPVWGTLYLMGKDTTIYSWDDLKGKRIQLMAKGMTPEVLFKYLLNKNNISPHKDVILDYSFPTHIDLANAVAANQAELAVISEPMVSLVMQKNKTVVPLMDLNVEWKKVNQNIPIAQTAFMVQRAFANSNPAELSAILKAYEKSTHWVNQNQEDAAKLFVKYNVLPNLDAGKSSIARCNLQFEHILDAKMHVNEYLKIFYNLNPVIVGNKIPDDNFYLN